LRCEVRESITNCSPNWARAWPASLAEIMEATGWQKHNCAGYRIAK
jgi:hypothetical protein